MRMLIIILVFFLQLFVACNSDYKKASNVKVAAATHTIEKTTSKNFPKIIPDTIIRYVELRYDTVYDNRKISEDIFFKIKSYSLNDSLAISELTLNNKTKIDYFHTVVTDFMLSSKANKDFRQISKTEFEDSMIPEFYVSANISETEIDSVQSNFVFLTTNLIIPETENLWKVNYSIEINQNRMGNMHIINSYYVP